jgi:predicted dehydrogenase
MMKDGTLHVGIMGTQHGHVSGKLRCLLESPDYEVVGICEPEASASAQARGDASFHGLAWLTQDDMLSDPAIDLVVVEVPVSEAVSTGRRVIQAGKHLHLEKPPGNDMAAFAELLAEARQGKLRVQIGYLWRFHDGITAALEAARNGWLGHVYLVRGTSNNKFDRSFRASHAVHRGGAMFVMGCHLIDLVVALMGRPRAVTGWLRHDTKVDDSFADNTLAVLEYRSALAVVASAARMPLHTEHRSFELIGTRGSIMVQPIEATPKLRVGLQEAHGPYRAGWHEITLPRQPRFEKDFRELARAIRRNQPLQYSYEHELLVHETLLRACGELE